MSSTAATSAPVTKDFGSLTITASRTVDGGYAINTFTGPHREHNLCFATADRDLYRRVYAVIRDGGRAGVRPDGIHAALRDTLTGDLHEAMRRRNGQRIELLNTALDRLDTPAQAKADRAALADIANTITTGPAAHELSGFGKLRAAHAAAVAADRARRQPALFEAVAR